MFKKKIIYGCEGRGDGNQPYLYRWELIRTKWFNLYLHKFVRSDADEHHDHPWDFYTFILWRGYIEETIECEINVGWDTDDAENNTFTVKTKETKVTNTIKPLSLNYRPATHRHRVVLHKEMHRGQVIKHEQPAWSLVLTGSRIREWGFYTKKGWQNFKDYFKENGC